MMRRIATYDNLAAAYALAARGKRRREEVAAFSARLSENLNRMAVDLRAGRYEPGPFRRFVVRDPKVRVIHAAPFRDRVVHHAIMRVAEPVFERGAMHQSYACRKGKGNRAARLAAAACARRWSWCLKMDVRKYFDSIDHEVLLKLIGRRFKDAAFLDLLRRIVSSYRSTEPGRGLPIGTLCSQVFANLYLDGLDRRLVEHWRCGGYQRFMDDILVWDDSPARLEPIGHDVGEWLRDRRGLDLKTTTWASASSQLTRRVDARRLTRPSWFSALGGERTALPGAGRPFVDACGSTAPGAHLFLHGGTP